MTFWTVALAAAIGFWGPLLVAGAIAAAVGETLQSGRSKKVGRDA